MSRAARVALGLVLGLVVLWLLFTVVFPWVDGNLLDVPTLAGLAVARGARNPTG